MRFSYSTTDPSQREIDSLPRVPLVLRYGNQRLEVMGLVDSGATVNVLPYEAGLQLGAVWEDTKAVLRLGGNLGRQPAMPLFVTAELADFAPVRLAFAWTNIRHAPLILGQMNFFVEFDVCFYRSRLEFDVNPK
ncbi:MAG TPA: hypothetical protein VGB07_23830 [Blastocatellia bacterium]